MGFVGQSESAYIIVLDTAVTTEDLFFLLYFVPGQTSAFFNNQAFGYVSLSTCASGI